MFQLPPCLRPDQCTVWSSKKRTYTGHPIDGPISSKIEWENFPYVLNKFDKFNWNWRNNSRIQRCALTNRNSDFETDKLQGKNRRNVGSTIVSFCINYKAIENILDLEIMVNKSPSWNFKISFEWFSKAINIDEDLSTFHIHSDGHVDESILIAWKIGFSIIHQ